jgi:phosphoglycerol transferase
LTRFVEWCKTQEFYEDTVIVVAGDHLSMAPVVKNEFTPDGYDRSVYNAIINSDLEPVNATNRLFTTMDMFPTILASLGFEIEGDRLGLGTNLYSDKKTVMEEVGKKEFMEEISKNSKLYNKEILGTR